MAVSYCLNRMQVGESFMIMVGKTCHTAQVTRVPVMRSITIPCAFTDGAVFMSTDPAATTAGCNAAHGTIGRILAHTSFGVDTDATLVDAPRQTQPAEFYFIAHNKPDASKRGNSGGAGVFTCPAGQLDTVNLGVSGQFGVAAAVRPGVSPHIVLTPMNHAKTESLLKLAEGLTQQRESAFSSFVDGCPAIRKGATFQHEKDA